MGQSILVKLATFFKSHTNYIGNNVISVHHSHFSATLTDKCNCAILVGRAFAFSNKCSAVFVLLMSDRLLKCFGDTQHNFCLECITGRLV